MNDPQVSTLRGKVGVVRDESFPPTSAAVEIVTADGQTHRVSQKAARGSAENPMSDNALEAKLRAAARDAIPGHDISPLIAAIWDLDNKQDVSRLATLAVPRQ